jgi:hypothetical protein
VHQRAHALGRRSSVGDERRRAPSGGPGAERRHRSDPAVEPDDDGVGGRGLLLVEALSTDWGWASGAEGTTVWFELDRE